MPALSHPSCVVMVQLIKTHLPLPRCWLLHSLHAHLFLFCLLFFSPRLGKHRARALEPLGPPARPPSALQPAHLHSAGLVPAARQHLVQLPAHQPLALLALQLGRPLARPGQLLVPPQPAAVLVHLQQPHLLQR
jgi:hypothetical protein